MEFNFILFIEWSLSWQARAGGVEDDSAVDGKEESVGDDCMGEGRLSPQVTG